MRAATEVTLAGVAIGDPRLRPATPVDVENLGPQLSGRYVLTEAVHRISRASGYLTEISSTPPAAPERRRETLAVPGVVDSVDDPDGLARVRVQLPTFADIESAWMEVLTVGAGSGKGLVALPDVGDRVLVLLLHADPAQGVVLGGLYGTGGAPDSGVVDGSVKRYTLVTAGGQRIVLDDENGELVIEDSSDGRLTMGQRRIRLEDATGTSLEMSPESVVLHSAVSLRIEAPGNGIVIKASSVDFESG
jgi:phage baseplate assembly protein gpV